MTDITMPIPVQGKRGRGRPRKTITTVTATTEETDSHAPPHTPPCEANASPPKPDPLLDLPAYPFERHPRLDASEWLGEDIELLHETVKNAKQRNILPLNDEITIEPPVPPPPPQAAKKPKKPPMKVMLTPDEFAVEYNEIQAEKKRERQERIHTAINVDAPLSTLPVKLDLPLTALPTQNGGDELLETNLSQTVEAESSIKTVSKELFNTKSIELKTEVSHDEINNITRLQFLREKFLVGNVDVLVNSFLRLRVSKDRKSRREFIEALQTENRNTNPAGGFMARMFGAGGGGAV